ncbi:MAG: 50S ribosomal protein L15 [Elusimicrobia bacterium]|nr:50S ribosomal protein L15 [Elusimicrobiota bacterium]MBI3012363.1 50S ribosomal protein L15 [Elusimicrobiota bacterium]MBI4218329.1 50S ribosomal protein L15 [Elusimicrobiota bacterium]
MDLSHLSPAPGSHHRRKVVGRGVGSGHGRHATRGMKGQRSRRGDSKMIGFEGGQMPLLRRIPKRGFSVPFPKYFSVVNLDLLDQSFQPKSEVTPQILIEKGILKRSLPLKILGKGKLEKPLQVSAQVFSQSAREKIVAAGGTVTVLSGSER